MHHPPEVDIDQPLKVFFAGVSEPRPVANPGVVEKRIEAISLGADSLRPFEQCVPLAAVHHLRIDAPAGVIQRRTGLSQRLGVDVREPEVAAGGIQALAERSANPVSGAGDGGGLACKVALYQWHEVVS